MGWILGLALQIVRLIRPPSIPHVSGLPAGANGYGSSVRTPLLQISEKDITCSTCTAQHGTIDNDGPRAGEPARLAQASIGSLYVSMETRGNL